ncbi:MAG TPA: DUF2970 domain-containing protein [Casimicrobiaceae bacterium]|jgi:hypothetical protein|nr:DUF2970 domain-containing protein [Casimicrobiaceae bacterium]
MRKPEPSSDVNRAACGSVLRSAVLEAIAHYSAMPDPDPYPPPVGDPDPPRASFLRVLGAVFASFLGIRKKAASERDAMSIKPLHLIIAGLLGAAILATAVLTLVRFITHGG